MTFSNLMNSLFAKLKFVFKSHISINTLWILTNEGSKFKLDRVELKHSYILWIKVINFKTRLIDIVYFFEIPSTYYQCCQGKI